MWDWLLRRFKTPKVEEVKPKPPKREVWDLNKMKHEFERRGFTVTIGDLNMTGGYIPRLPVMADPYDVEPAFHVRYYQVKCGPNINLANLKKNVHTFKVQTREVVTDPKRVYRRHKQRILKRKAREQLMRDHFLFV